MTSLKKGSVSNEDLSEMKIGLKLMLDCDKNLSGWRQGMNEDLSEMRIGLKFSVV